MNIWPDIVVGLWLLYASWEDYKKRLIDLGVPVTIVLTRVAVEGPLFLLHIIPALIPFYLFLKLLENYHRMVIWLNFPGPKEPIWYDGDTYLIIGTSIYLGLNSFQAFGFLLLSLLSSTIFYVLIEALKGKKVGEALTEPQPLSPGVLIAYASLLTFHIF